MTKPNLDRCPVQVTIHRHEQPEVANSVHLAAYEVYSHIFGPQQALIEGNCRGGFGIGELVAFLYARGFPHSEWKQRFKEALEGNSSL